MSNKITLNDFGRLVKPKILTEVFLLHNQDVDPNNWWHQVLRLNATSKSYKKDMIAGTYGDTLEKLFSTLEIDKYVGVISSFIVFHSGKYKFVNSIEESKRLQSQKGKHYSIRAIGITIHKEYDPTTHKLGDVWDMMFSNQPIKWYYKPKHLIPIEDVEQFNNVQVGDMIVFKKTQALVINVKELSRLKFYSNCSWTKKSITVLSGNQARQVRLITNRPYQVIKHH